MVANHEPLVHEPTALIVVGGPPERAIRLTVQFGAVGDGGGAQAPMMAVTASATPALIILVRIAHPR